MSGPIALLTDFGTADPYVGIVKGVIASIHPEARVIDICHELPPQSVGAACRMLSVAAPHFPDGTIFLAVVDPGVGTARRPIAARTDRHIFVAPDNGLLSFARPAEIRILDREELFLRPVSSTFHGRDVFAPVAARLAAGLPFREVGSRVRSMRRLTLPRPVRKGGALVGHVVWIDRFGNAVTDIEGSAVRRGSRVRLKGATIAGLSRTYGDHKRGTLIALIGSSDHLEISLVNGSAAGALGAKVGDAVEVLAE
jgi:S-adenosylmethionine hydrolase